MQKILNHILKRKISTERVENMPSTAAVSALDRRVQQMLALQATQPLPQSQSFKVLLNPFQKPQEV
jgi:hypothetical protein